MAVSSRPRPGARISDAQWLLAALVLVALALRIVLALDAPGGRIGGDPAVYDHVGVSLADGRGWSRAVGTGGGRSLALRPAALRPTALHPPAWPLVLGAAYLVTDHEDRLDLAGTPGRPGAAGAPAAARSRWTAGRVVNALLGTGAVLLVGLVALELWGPRVALVATGVAALYPALAVLGAALLSEPLFVVLELGALYAVLRHRRPGGGRRWLALAGVLCGMAVLTRANGAVLLLPLALGAWTGRPRWSRRALAAPALVVLAAVLAVAPWTLRNALVLHAPVPVSTDLGQTLAGTYNPLAAANRFRWRNTRRLPAADAVAVAQPTEAARSSALAHAGLAYLAAHPLDVVRASAWNTARMLELDPAGRRDLAGELRSRRLASVSFAGFAVLAVLALAGTAAARARRAPAWLWLVPVLMWLGTVPFAVNFSRFRAPIDPFLVLLAALALTALGERAARLVRSWAPAARSGPSPSRSARAELTRRRPGAAARATAPRPAA
jgi:hypothetical protein